jgi:hypothetical protein
LSEALNLIPKVPGDDKYNYVDANKEDPNQLHSRYQIIMVIIYHSSGLIDTAAMISTVRRDECGASQLETIPAPPVTTTYET